MIVDLYFNAHINHSADIKSCALKAKNEILDNNPLADRAGNETGEVEFWK